MKSTWLAAGCYFREAANPFSVASITLIEKYGNLGLQENRAMKIGLDFGLVGEKVDKSVAVNTQTGQTDSVTGQHTRSFTISK